jgi:hypothetical protein
MLFMVIERFRLVCQVATAVLPPNSRWTCTVESRTGFPAAIPAMATRPMKPVLYTGSHGNILVSVESTPHTTTAPFYLNRDRTASQAP